MLRSWRSTPAAANCSSWTTLLRVTRDRSVMPRTTPPTAKIMITMGSTMVVSAKVQNSDHPEKEATLLR